MSVSVIYLEGPGGSHWRIPDTHYSSDPEEALFFYGGTFSSFVGGPWTIVYKQPWSYRPYKAIYETVEHFFQASKARSMKDHEYIRKQRGPFAAKKAGSENAMRRRGLLIRPDWEDVKLEVMMAGDRVKFYTDLVFQADLMFTGNRLIAEDSPRDFEWGIRDSSGGYTGQNLKGKSLMAIRSELLEED